jgi:CubicO group peptidase (beta-lactamase class C family)
LTSRGDPSHLRPMSGLPKIIGLASLAAALLAGAAAYADTPGCATGLAQTGHPPVLAAFGSADLEHGVPLTPNSIFEAGSVSKQFTAAAIFVLVQEGRLKLTDDVRKYLPEMPDYGQPLTIEHLLTHTSGLRDWGEVEEVAGWPRGSRVYANDDILAATARQRALNYPPGQDWLYGNTGFNLAAVVVARVAGQSLADFTRDRFFRPLGMAHTSWRDDFTRLVPGRALAYEPGPGGPHLAMPFENDYGHAGLLTTVGDLLIWNDALTSGRLGAVVTEGLQRPALLADGRRTPYGHGVFLNTYKGVREISHPGVTAGYRAWVGRFPDQGLSIAVLCNGAEFDAGARALQLADSRLVFPPSALVPPPPAPTDFAELLMRPGLYLQDGAWAQLWIAADGDHLRLQNGPSLIPTGEGRYAYWSEELIFHADGSLERRMPNGQRSLYRRATPGATPPQALQAAVGDYVSEDAQATVRISLRAGQLFIAPTERPSAALPLVPLIEDGFTWRQGLLRLVRGPDGSVTGLRYQGVRVWDLSFRRNR